MTIELTVTGRGPGRLRCQPAAALMAPAAVRTAHGRLLPAARPSSSRPGKARLDHLIRGERLSGRNIT